MAVKMAATMAIFCKRLAISLEKDDFKVEITFVFKWYSFIAYHKHLFVQKHKSDADLAIKNGTIQK